MHIDRIKTNAAYFAGKYRWVAMFFIMALAVFLYSRIPAVYADSPIQQAQLRTQFQNLVKGLSQSPFGDSYLRRLNPIYLHMLIHYEGLNQRNMEAYI